MSTIDALKNREETVWLNPNLKSVEPMEKVNGYGYVYMKAAQSRLQRFMPLMEKLFPETADRKGLIESPLIEAPEVKDWMNAHGAKVSGRVFIKDDAHLPIAGSVKARGGIHEVLAIAERLAMQAGLMTPAEDHSRMDAPEFRELFGQYTIQVGSTGNLGISIGRTAARLGFQVIVHMSSEAKEWKKQLLRSEGVTVKEYDTDYTQAVAAGRAAAEADEKSFFIDDENSRDLFFGYSTAALRLKSQMRRMGIIIGEHHPVFIYLPCGVGGAPAGITFGMKQIFVDDAHCFFAEPTEAPCFTLGMASGKRNEICVQEIGLSGKTIADGLAVGRPSGFACSMMDTLMSGSFTVADEKLLAYQKMVQELTGLYLEPSACVGFKALEDFERPGTEWERYLKNQQLAEDMANATHIIWATGGGLVPEEER